MLQDTAREWQQESLDAASVLSSKGVESWILKPQFRAAPEKAQPGQFPASARLRSVSVAIRAHQLGMYLSQGI